MQMFGSNETSAGLKTLCHLLQTRSFAPLNTFVLFRLSVSIGCDERDGRAV